MAAPRVRTVKQSVQVKQEEQPIAVRLREWLEKNRSLISGAVAGLFVVALLFVGVQSYLEGQERRAQQAYAPLAQQWPKDTITADNQAWEKIISDLQKFIQEHNGSKAAWMASMDLTRAFCQVHRFEEALVQSRKTLDGAPDSMSRSMARYQTAVIMQSMGRPDEAISQWTAMKSEGSLVSERELNWHLANLYRTKKDYPKTIEFLELALKATADYPANQLLEDELSSAKTMSSKSS